MNLISDEETKKNYYYSETYQGWDLDEALKRVTQAQLTSCEKEVAEQIEALRTESEARRELLMRMTDRCNGLLQQQEAIKREANQQVEALQAEIVSLKNDVNTLNDIVRFKTDMGQGEIDSLSVDIEAIKREAEQAGVRKVVEWIDEYKLFALVPNPQEYVINALDWQARLKEWGIEEK